MGMPMNRVHADAKHQLLFWQLKAFLKKGQRREKVVNVTRLVEDENISEHDRLFRLVRDALQLPRVAVVGVAIQAKKEVDQKVCHWFVTEDLFLMVKPFETVQESHQIGITGCSNMPSRNEKTRNSRFAVITDQRNRFDRVTQFR